MLPFVSKGKLFETQYSLNKSFICRVILERWKLHFARIDEMITSLTLHSNVYNSFFFFYLGFLSRTFTIQETAGEGEGYLFSSCLPLPPASQTLRC